MEQPIRNDAANPWVRLATEAVTAFASSGKKLPVPMPLPVELSGKAGVFVSIKKSGLLRGCIGTFSPMHETIAQEIIANAIQAASQDPRFPPIAESELEDLSISVDVLSAPEPCTERQLDPAIYGIIVQSGWRRGLLLPDLEGVESVQDQIAIAKSKAGIAPDEPAALSRFTVERHH